MIGAGDEADLAAALQGVAHVVLRPERGDHRRLALRRQATAPVGVHLDHPLQGRIVEVPVGAGVLMGDDHHRGTPPSQLRVQVGGGALAMVVLAFLDLIGFIDLGDSAELPARIIEFPDHRINDLGFRPERIMQN